MIKLESDVEAHLYGAVKRLKGECIKLSAGEGFPDRLVVLPGGIIFFVETKRDDRGSKLSALQKARISRLRRLGVRVHTPKTKASIDKLIAAEIRGGNTETIDDTGESITEEDMMDEV